MPETAKAYIQAKGAGALDYLNTYLDGRTYLLDRFTVADGYLFTMLAWANRMKFDLSAMPNLRAYKARVAARPKVQDALKAEGLLKAS